MFPPELAIKARPKKKEAEVSIALQSDRKASFGLVVKVMDIARKAVIGWLADAAPAAGSVYDSALAAFETPLFTQVLRDTGGNQLKAAQILGINRNTLRKRLNDLDLNPEDFAIR